jgi:outer membrane protein assembly factor BamB
MFEFSKSSARGVAGVSVLLAAVLFASWPAIAAGDQSPDGLVRTILQEAGVTGGMVVHIGCGDGRLTGALHANAGYLVHGLDADPTNVEKARAYRQKRGLSGNVSVVQWDGGALPYIDNLVNLVVAEQAVASMDEVMRVLAPGGVAFVKNKGKWTKTVKARPAELDEWTHYLHDASNNAVAHDTVVGPPRRMQWVGSPRYSRHHDRMSSVSGAVTSGGRVFYIFDEASPVSILLPPKWTVIARDAFNGTILWKRRMGNWHDHLWPLKSGPAQLPRRLVAYEDRVYVTLSLGGPLEALDAATGETVRTYDETAEAEEVVLSDGVLYVVANNIPGGEGEVDRLRRRGMDLPKVWSEAPKMLVAARAESGKVLWTSGRRVLPGTLAAGSGRVVFHDGERVICLDGEGGDEIWQSGPVARCDEILSFYLPTLVLYEDVIVCSAGETAGKQTGSWYEKGQDTMTALSAETGDVLWAAPHPPSGYRSPEDLLIVNGLVWTGETTSGRAKGVFTGRDVHTGEVVKEFSPDVDTYWFHHRCYRGKATDKYLLMSRTGSEFIDVENEHWDINHWVRGACLYGLMPANGLLYAPQNPCGCYQEAKSMGFNAMAPASAGPRIPESAATMERLERGPAYGQASPGGIAEGDWPTYRHDAARSGHASTSVPRVLESRWEHEIGGKLTSPVVAGGTLFVASIDAHTVHAIDAATGEPRWTYTAGGRVDSPPTIHDGLALFGCADGYVYALRASDGALAWRFLAAHLDQRLVAFEQVESVWPVHGSVLVQDGVLYCVAGRSMFVDGGLLLWRLDPATGRVLSKTTLDSREDATGKDIQDFVSWLNMPTALPDVLSSDGRYVYMRSQPFYLDGTRLPLKAMPRGSDADKGAPRPTQDEEFAHLFCPTGYLDDANWHRTYWMYGSTFVSGWCGYYLSGRVAPAGRVLTFDDANVYGFGRLPKYYKWTTPIEHHLFSADKISPVQEDEPDPGARFGVVRVEKSDSLNCAKTPLTVEAWVRPTPRGGVVVAQGGNAQGCALYLNKGRPYFAVRSNGAVGSVRADERIEGGWVHLAGVMTPEKELRIYVDGKQAGAAAGPGFIAGNPQEPLSIGADEGSVVGDYPGPFTMAGIIDEVSVYYRALEPDEIKADFENAAEARARRAEAALAFSFDGDTAADGSGNENHGAIVGAVAVEGREGRALRFSGGGRGGPEFTVNHHWTTSLPIFVRGIVLADGTVFVAGPPDTVDEEEAFKAIKTPEVQESLATYTSAFEDGEGATLLLASAAEGKIIGEYQLDASPVFDGMVAAGGRLYMALTSGKVLCMAGD